MPAKPRPAVPGPDFLAQLEMLDLTTLRPHPRNDGSHPPDELAHLRESIREHDIYRNVVVANDGTILAGHGVVLAAAAEGKTHVPGHRRPYGPDDPRALKILLGDNHIARLRMQNDAVLVELLQELTTHDPVAGLLGTGYDDAMLQILLAHQFRDPGAEDAEEGVDPLPLPPPESNVRMVQLFLTNETYPVFEQYLKALASAYDTTTVTDTVMECLAHAAAALNA